METSLLPASCSATARDGPSVSRAENDFQPSSPRGASYIIPRPWKWKYETPFFKNREKI